MSDREELEITDADIAKAMDGYITLGPAYFACRRIAEHVMSGADAKPLQDIAKKVTDQIAVAVHEYIEESLRNDLESNLQGYLRNLVERTVTALLTGEEWALQQYPLSKYHDGETIRAAVAKHGAEPLLMARIADLEREVQRLTETLRFMR